MYTPDPNGQLSHVARMPRSYPRPYHSTQPDYRIRESGYERMTRKLNNSAGFVCLLGLFDLILLAVLAWQILTRHG